MPVDTADPSQVRKIQKTQRSVGSDLFSKTSPLAVPLVAKTLGAMGAYAGGLGHCVACGPDHPLQVRELSRCGFRGEGSGAWCGSCRRVYALDDMTG